MNTKEILTKAKALVEAGWVQGAFAVDDNCMSIPYDAPSATRFCAMGAVWRMVDEEGERDDLGDPVSSSYIHVIKVFMEANNLEYQHQSVADWNDQSIRQHQEVLDAFDKAIAAAS